MLSGMGPFCLCCSYVQIFMAISDDKVLVPWWEEFVGRTSYAVDHSMVDGDGLDIVWDCWLWNCVAVLVY